MKLSDCRSYSLLPRFSRNDFMASLCAAIDSLVSGISNRCGALPCENSALSVSACCDDELSQIADDLGVIPYYPDLPRDTRENLIVQAKTWTRQAGTTGAVIAMVNALFDTESTTIDDESTEAFHYLIEVADNFAESKEINFKRFNECLQMLGHTTTTPDGFTFHYSGSFDANATALSGDALSLYETDGLCAYPEIVAVGGIMGAQDLRLYAMGTMTLGAIKYPVRTLSENNEVYGNRLEIWPSSYTPHAVVFPEKSGVESSVQMMSGTLRKWGTKANRGVEIDVIDGSPMTLGAIKYPVRTLSENNEVYGNDLKVYTKPPCVPVVIVFPEKPQDEPTTQMAGGTIRITGTKANRGILLNKTYGAVPN